MHTWREVLYDLGMLTIFWWEVYAGRMYSAAWWVAGTAALLWFIPSSDTTRSP